MMLSPLVQAGALQNSQSPVDTEGGGDGATVEPSRSRRWSILLTFEKLMYWSKPNQTRRPPTQRPCYRNNAVLEELGELEVANAALLF